MNTGIPRVSQKSFVPRLTPEGVYLDFPPHPKGADTGLAKTSPAITAAKATATGIFDNRRMEEDFRSRLEPVGSGCTIHLGVPRPGGEGRDHDDLRTLSPLEHPSGRFLARSEVQ